MSTAPLKYPLLMRILHWILALLLLGMIALGLIMSELPKETSYRGDLYMLHKSLGVTILALAALRLGLRLTRKLPDMPAVISRMDYLAARWAHRLFYVFMFAIPISGYLMSNAGGHGVSWFGFGLPTLIGPDKELGGFMNESHELMAYALLVLVALHVAGVIKHYVVEKQNLLRRMW